MRPLALFGRILFALIFVFSAFSHFSRSTIDYAAHVGVPMASLLVPAVGLLALVGGLMILVGFHARIGAVLLMAFLIPVTVMMHNFWSATDAQLRQMQMVNFMKNTALFGAALYMAYFGSGPLSVDEAIANRQPVARPLRPSTAT